MAVGLPQRYPLGLGRARSPVSGVITYGKWHAVALTCVHEELYKRAFN